MNGIPKTGDLSLPIKFPLYRMLVALAVGCSKYDGLPGYICPPNTKVMLGKVPLPTEHKGFLLFSPNEVKEIADKPSLETDLQGRCLS